MIFTHSTHFFQQFIFSLPSVTFPARVKPDPLTEFPQQLIKLNVDVLPSRLRHDHSWGKELIENNKFDERCLYLD